jgi:hypothetical protein
MYYGFLVIGHWFFGHWSLVIWSLVIGHWFKTLQYTLYYIKDQQANNPKAVFGHWSLGHWFLDFNIIETIPKTSKTISQKWSFCFKPFNILQTIPKTNKPTPKDHHSTFLD